jgi:hypothetical protein
LFDDKGRLAIAAGHINDPANCWQWCNTPSMPFKPGADALRLGTNAVMYAMTH